MFVSINLYHTLSEFAVVNKKSRSWIYQDDDSQDGKFGVGGVHGPREARLGAQVIA